MIPELKKDILNNIKAEAENDPKTELGVVVEMIWSIYDASQINCQDYKAKIQGVREVMRLLKLYELPKDTTVSDYLKNYS